MAYPHPVAIQASRVSIESYASKVSVDNGLADFLDDELDPLINFVAELGGEISYEDPDDIPRYEDGSITVNGPCDFQIVLSRYTGALRDRFTIAHELGHYFLHSDQGQKPISASRKGSGLTEWEANWFAAALLMPTDAVSQFCKQNLGATPHSVASRFRVSVLAAEYRMKHLGLLSS